MELHWRTVKKSFGTICTISNTGAYGWISGFCYGLFGSLSCAREPDKRARCGTMGYEVALFAIAAAGYALLSVLLWLSGRPNRTRTGLIFACVATALASITIAMGWGHPLRTGGAIAELGSSAAWYAFALHLLHKQFHGKAAPVRLLSWCGLVIGIL